MFDYRRVSQNRGKIWAPSPLVHTSCAHKIGLVNALARALKGKQMRFSPHLCVGFLFLGLYPARPPPPALLPSSLVLITHNLSSHTTCLHTTCSHTSCHHATCSLTHNLSSHNLLTHTHLVLTQLTTCSHTTCPHTHLVITPSLCVAGVALGDIHLHFAWQAWHLVTSTLHFARQAGHLVTSTFTWRGRRGT